MTTMNDVTGDSIRSKAQSKKYRDNYDLIFGKKKKKEVTEDLDCSPESSSEEKRL